MVKEFILKVSRKNTLSEIRESYRFLQSMGFKPKLVKKQVREVKKYE